MVVHNLLNPSGRPACISWEVGSHSNPTIMNIHTFVAKYLMLQIWIFRAGAWSGSDGLSLSRYLSTCIANNPYCRKIRCFGIMCSKMDPHFHERSLSYHWNFLTSLWKINTYIIFYLRLCVNHLKQVCTFKM